MNFVGKKMGNKLRHKKKENKTIIYNIQTKGVRGGSPPLPEFCAYEKRMKKMVKMYPIDPPSQPPSPTFDPYLTTWSLRKTLPTY